MAAYSELTVEQGATFSASLAVQDEQNAFVNISSYSASSMMRKSYYSTTSYIIDCTITDAANGQITLSIPSANSANLPTGRMVYDVVISDANTNTTLRVVEGIVTIIPSVTR